MKVNEALNAMEEGECIKVSATDMGFAKDVESWCERTGNTFEGRERKGKENIVTIRKGSQVTTQQSCQTAAELPQGKTMIVFDGDLDKVLASFIIANGAAAMGRPVTQRPAKIHLRQGEEILCGEDVRPNDAEGNRQAEAFQYEHAGHGN